MVEQIPLVITGYSDRRTPAEAAVRRFDAVGRLRRAAAGLGACWGAALLGAFIPVAHFLLVPGFGVAGIVVAFRRLRTDARLDRIDGTCPDCGEKQAFEASRHWAPPVAVTCRGCGRGLTAALESSW